MARGDSGYPNAVTTLPNPKLTTEINISRKKSHKMKSIKKNIRMKGQINK